MRVKRALHPSTWRLGRQGSGDRVVLRMGRDGVYLSVRAIGRRGFWLALGPGYVNRAGLRP